MIDKIEAGKYYLVDMKKLYERGSKSACLNCENSDIIYVNKIYKGGRSGNLLFDYNCFYCNKEHDEANVEYAIE